MLCVKPWPAWFHLEQVGRGAGTQASEGPAEDRGPVLGLQRGHFRRRASQQGLARGPSGGGVPTDPSCLITHGLSFTHKGALVFLQKRKQGQMVEGSRVSLLDSQPE